MIFFKKKLKYNLGVVDDPRPRVEKDKDFTHDELAGAVILDWKEKSEWKHYTQREQDGSLSCVGQSAAKAFEIIFGDVSSAHPIYRSRVNYPQGGMWLQNMGEIAKKVGTTTEAADPSQWMNETEMNRPITVPTPITVEGYVTITDPTNIDAIAEAIELFKHCHLLVHANKKEYEKFIPEYQGLPVNFGHGICAIDYFLYNGKKAILIEDSTGSNTSKKGQRIFTEDFIKYRVDGAMYFLLPKPTVPPPHVTFTPTLKYGMVGPRVVELQDFLKSKGFFLSSVPSTGNFLKITKKSVIDFQKSRGLVPDGIVGPKTCAELNM